MDKKAVELTLNTIIIAIIVLLVLVLLAYFLIDSGSKFKEGTKCTEVQGTCMESCTPGVMSPVGDGTFCPTGTQCCRIGG